MQRLKTRPQFQAVLAGPAIARTAHFALHRTGLDSPLQDSKGPHSETGLAVALFPARRVWVGAMAPKRWAKRAVTRNVIKRQIYNVSTCFESTLPVAAYLVRLRAGFDKATFISATSDALKAAVREELYLLFKCVTPGVSAAKS